MCQVHYCDISDVSQLCTKSLSCGHPCNGIRDEEECLPCLKGCGDNTKLTQDNEDQCMICFTCALEDEPCIQVQQDSRSPLLISCKVDCGHVFHIRCVRKLLEIKWSGPRITFGFCKCPVCAQPWVNLKHPAVAEGIAPITKLYEEVFTYL